MTVIQFPEQPGMNGSGRADYSNRPTAEEVLEGARVAFGLGFGALGLVYPFDDAGVCACAKADCHSPGKHPVGGPRSIYRSLDELWQVVAGVGWPAAPGLFAPTGEVNRVTVIDCDGGGDGVWEFEQWLAACDVWLPRGLRQKTPNGEHIFVQYVPDLKAKTGLRGCIDIRNDGGLIVIAPSLHVSGQRYMFDMTERVVPALPEGFVNLLRREKSRKASTNGVNGSSSQNGEGRDQRANDFAFQCKKNRLTRQQAMAEARTLWESFDQPPVASHPFTWETHQEKVNRVYDDDSIQPDVIPDWRPQVGEKRHLTDDGNALRLIDRYESRLRHVAARGQWLVWDGSRWRWDDDSMALSLARETVRSIYTEASSETDPDRRESIAKHAWQSEASSRVAGMLMLAKGDRRTAVRLEQLDRDPWMLNTPSGTVDLRTGAVRAPDPADMITMSTAVAPTDDPLTAEQPPRWLRFIEEITCGDVELSGYLQMWAGYALTGVCSEQAMLFCHGQGSNGKGVFVHTLRKLLGGYGHAAVSDLLLSSRNSPHKTRLAELVGKRLVVVSEVKGNETFDEGLFQQLTGEDPITANFMRQDNFTFIPTFKLFMLANHKPKVMSATFAFWRRMRLVPFLATFSKENGKGDPRLGDRLVDEEGGQILAWAVRGCLAWQRLGMSAPDVVARAVDSYRSAEDVTAGFFDDRSNLGSGLFTPWAVLWPAYEQWADSEMIEPRQRETQRSFRARLEGLGCVAGRDHSGKVRGWHGIHVVPLGIANVFPMANPNTPSG